MNRFPNALLTVILATLLAPATIAAISPGGAIDFSTAGYAGGAEPPVVPARLRVVPLGDGRDDTAVIQTALDEVGRMEPDARGFRGAVVLDRGTFCIAGQLRVAASGVVLRGRDATLLATGISRRTLIAARGAADRTLGPAREIVDSVVPAGAVTLTLANVSGLAPGARVVVRRPCTAAWTAALGMDRFSTPFADIRVNWSPGSRDLEWERTLIAVDRGAQTVTLDAPITTALEERFGGGTLHTVSWPGRLRQVGIENLECISAFDATQPADEEHAWIGIQLDNVEDAWVRSVSLRHFAGIAVHVGPGARAVTVSDCAALSPVAENGGWRRMGFYAGGQQILVQRCTSDEGRRDFVAGFCSAGPNVFLDCTATRACADSGPFESWASGVLYDNVRIEGAGLALANLGLGTQGAGWTAADSALWNCSALTVRLDQPPGAPNRVVSDPTTPSLYRAQLAARRGADVTDAPANLAAHAGVDRQAPLFVVPPAPPSPPPATARPLAIVNGRFTVGGHVLLGGADGNAWWRGQLVPTRAAAMGTSPTRWAPAHDGPGWTEDLDALTDELVARGQAFYQTWPALWQDRRRDDHARIWREDADVCAPFFELPWARSGVGRGADGLSKFDLTKFNPWYWSRLRELARLCAAKGLVHVDFFYNNHNLQESGAHWLDYPWRPANCLQPTGFTEPPVFDGARNNTIHVADVFYDVSDPVRRDLHTRFIRHGLDVFADEPNVIHLLGFQFAGPEAFQRFFLGVVADWNRVHGRRARVALQTTKAITDAILADPALAGLVDAIDLTYWQYLADGSLYAPDGRGQRSFREMRGARFHRDATPPSTPELVYRQVREYRDRFPKKAIVAGDTGVGPIPAIMAGAAAAIPTLTSGPGIELPGHLHIEDTRKAERADAAFLRFVREEVGDALVHMNPQTDPTAPTWALADDGQCALLYSLHGTTIDVPAPFRGATFSGVWFDPRTGATREAAPVGAAQIAKPTAEPWLLCLRRIVRAPSNS